MQLHLSVCPSVCLSILLSLKFLVKQVYSLVNVPSLWNITQMTINILLLNLSVSMFVCLSVHLSIHPSDHPSVTLFRYTFSSHFQIKKILLEGSDWNFRQLFISICMMDTQKGNNQNIFLSELLPLFLSKIMLHF